MLGLHMQLESCNPNPFCTWLERAQGCFASLLSVIFPREGVSTGLPDSLQPECEQVSSGSKPSCPWVSRRPGTRAVGDRLPEHTAGAGGQVTGELPRPRHIDPLSEKTFYQSWFWWNVGVPLSSRTTAQPGSAAEQVSLRSSSALQPSWRGSQWLQHLFCTTGEARVTVRTGLIDLDCSLSSGSVWVVRLMQVTVWSTLPCLQLNCSVLVGDVVLSPCEICFSPTDWAFCAEVPDLTPISKFPSATQQNIWGKPFCVSVCVCV